MHPPTATKTALPPGLTQLTAAEAAAKLAGINRGVTIHRRPKAGSVPCFGRCGRRISANKALCLECQTKAELDAAQAAPIHYAPSPAAIDPGMAETSGGGYRG